MFRRCVLASMVLLLTLEGMGQNRPVQFEDLQSLQAREAKPVVVLIMTDWCKYCHAMQHTMLKHSKVSVLLGNKFHTVFLNAEDRKDIFFAGRNFKYKSGMNELAVQLAKNHGQVSFPSLCILNSQNEILYQHDGYLSAQAMLFILRKIVEN